MKLFTVILVLILTISCSHNNLIQEAHVSGNCSEKIKDINPPIGQSLIDLSKQATTGSVSIAIAGVGAATDALVLILTNPVTKVTLCVVTVSMALSEYASDTEICDLATGPGYNPKLAQKALDHTKSWRCPNLDYVSKGLRKVATCYADRNEKDKAKLQLENILKNKTISPCISEDETIRVLDQIDEL